jgi:hypothetical protein
MKILVPINQAAVIKQGLEAPHSTVVVDFPLNSLPTEVWNVLSQGYNPSTHALKFLVSPHLDTVHYCFNSLDSLVKEVNENWDRTITAGLTPFSVPHPSIPQVAEHLKALYDYIVTSKSQRKSILNIVFPSVLKRANQEFSVRTAAYRDTDGTIKHINGFDGFLEIKSTDALPYSAYAQASEQIASLLPATYEFMVSSATYAKLFSLLSPENIELVKTLSKELVDRANTILPVLQATATTRLLDNETKQMESARFQELRLKEALNFLSSKQECALIVGRFNDHLASTQEVLDRVEQIALKECGLACLPSGQRLYAGTRPPSINDNEYATLLKLRKAIGAKETSISENKAVFNFTPTPANKFNYVFDLSSPKLFLA